MGPRSKRGVIVAAALAALVTSAVATTAVTAGAQAPPHAGSPHPALVDLGARASTARDHVTASHDADVDTTLLAPGVARTVSVDVADTVLDVRLEPVPSGAPGWSAWDGTIAGEPGSSATVVRSGDDVAGLFTTASGSYRIRTTTPGRQVVQEIAGPFPDQRDDHPLPAGIVDLGVATDAADPAPPPAGDGPADPAIDVLIAYTPGALAYAGGLSAVNSEIALAISATNLAYGNSGVAGRLRLVGTTALTENFLFDDKSQVGLGELTSANDGHSDQIHALRNSTGADLVSVLVHDDSSCGVAWLLPGTSGASVLSSLGFSLVDFSCAVDNFSFAHELGHNMGLSHDRYVETKAALFPYAYGYVNLAKGWRTIMAYRDQCDDQQPAVACPRLRRFSNPDQTYEGAPLGRPATGSSPADERKALNNTQGFVANWRAKPTPFTSWSRFVAQQYRDFLGRSPTASESSTDAGRLTTGDVTPQGYIDGLLKGSFGARYAPVTRLYFAYFVLSPDPGGLDYWVRKYQGGMKLSAISSNFAASSEFTSKYGTLSNRAFVNKIYVNLFERTGDASGVGYWTGKLDRRERTRGAVMIEFSESSEFKRARGEEIDVVLLYRSLLQRSATPTEFAAAVARLQGGAGVPRLILETLDSPAYAGRITK